MPDLQYADRLKQEGAEVHLFMNFRSSASPANNIANFLRLAIFVRQEKISVVLSFGMQCDLISAAVRIFTKPKLRVIANFTGLGQHFATKRLGILKRVVLSIIATSNYVVVQNRDDRESIIKHCGDSVVSRLVLQPGSGVSAEKFGGYRDAQEPYPVAVGFVARALRAKGILDFIEVAKSVTADFGNIEFQLFTDLNGTSDLTKAEVELVKNSPFISIKGFRPAEEIFSRIHILLMPSTYGEGLPRSFLEASVSGVVTVAYENRGVNDWIENWINGVRVPRGDLAALSSAVTRYACDAVLFKSNSKAIYGLAVTQFDVDRICDWYVKHC